MADGRGKQTDSSVNTFPANLIGRENLISNEKNQHRYNEHSLKPDRSLSEWNYLENENNSESHSDFPVGGVTCDTEDKGCSELDVNDSSKFLPRLVFLDSDENISRNTDNISLNNPETSYYREERSVSDSAVANNHHLPVLNSHLNDYNSSGHLTDESTNPLLHSQHSHASQVSSDSDLIRDHTMATEQELATVAGEDYEQFLMEQTENDTFIDENDDWHCHATTAKIPEDKTARNQLIAVSVLCFLFMVGEAIGNS
jgi:hypothetical protein